MSQKRPTQQGESDDAIKGLGDGQGTRVGAPDQSLSASKHSDSPSPRPERQTGVGSEASEGMHNAQQGGARDESDRTALESQETGRSTREADDRAGSEPLAEGGDQHRSGYGGAGGKPVNSTDTREPTRKR